MWRGHDEALVDYLLVLAEEWRYRGLYRDPALPYRESISEWLSVHYLCEGGDMPSWWGGPIHFSHQLKLTWKLPEWYEPRFGLVAPLVEPAYFWPA